VTAGAGTPPTAMPRLPSSYHSPQADVEVRLNTNESPEPPPAAFLEELAATVRGSSALNRYPDREATALRTAVGAAHGVGPDRIWCANGSNEVLQALLVAYGGPDRDVVLFEPTYALHSHLARLTRSRLVVGERDDDFLVPSEEAERLAAAGPALVLLCSPNNPTGRVEPRETVERLLRTPAGLVVVDEAYGQFAQCAGGGWPAGELVRAAGAGAGAQGGGARAVVVRTFSKAWAMAGLRLGYAVAPPDVVEALAAASLPYHLDALKQQAGLLALRYAPEMEARARRVVEARRRLLAGLAALPVQVWPSEANFVLMRPLGRDGHDVWEGLLRRSVLVRELSSWPRLVGCLRVTVGTDAECDRFLEALAEVLA
jgi:histidinol-phosphate aminotransferase